MNQAAQTAKRSGVRRQLRGRRRTPREDARHHRARKLLTRAWHLLSEMQPAEASTPLRRP
jgi:hypothetical protein